ncbi:MAG: hypothetical protein IJW08_06030 [Lentisphaeria bacterium]|nr:hypothetical protein [Lentisphaeria bacterium]MBR7119944.1 hypothetical protein [Lentisphaeria bacterium]
MSNENSRITFFLSFVRAIDSGCRTDAEKGKLYSAITHYAFYDETPEHLPEHLSALFELIKPVFDAAQARKRKRTKTEQCSHNVSAEAEQNQNNVCTSSLNDIHTPLSINPNTSVSVYPGTVGEILAEAEKAGCVMSEEEAEKYFVCRMSTDWIDASGRKIPRSRIGYDLKRWMLNKQSSSGTTKQREVKYVPEF